MSKGFIWYLVISVLVTSCGIVFAIPFVSEKYIKTKIVSDYQNVAKLLDLNSKNPVDDLLQKIDTLSLDLADENKKLREECDRLQDKLTQQEKMLKKMF